MIQLRLTAMDKCCESNSIGQRYFPVVWRCRYRLNDIVNSNRFKGLPSLGRFLRLQFQIGDNLLDGSGGACMRSERGLRSQDRPERNARDHASTLCAVVGCP